MTVPAPRTGAQGAPRHPTEEELLRRVTALHEDPRATDHGLAAPLGRLDDPLLLAELGRVLETVEAARLSPAPARRARPLRIAVAATFTADNVVPLLRATLLAAGVDTEIHTCPYGRLTLELADPHSGLAAFRPDAVLCLLDAGAVLPRGWDPSRPEELADVLGERTATLTDAAAGFAARGGTAVLLHTVPLPRPDRRSVISLRGAAALGRIWRGANTALLTAGETCDGVYTTDLEAVLTDGAGPVRDERQYRFGRMAWTPSTELAYAREAAAFCRAVAGLGRKVLVLDLDNTLWGGVLGDDGPAGIELGTLYPGDCYTDLQHRALALRRQGVLLAVCSKNERELVDSVLDGHPDMVLRPDDFVAVLADWERKDAHIAALAEELGLTQDAFVFADDSAFECGMVGETLPRVAVAHLDGDPSDHSRTILDPAHFVQLGTTDTDTDRTGLYRDRRERGRLRGTHSSAEDYLRDLDIRVLIRPADAFTLPRLIQLELRTNQFNLTGRSHGEALTRRMADSPDHLVLAVEVTDRFGAEGVVGGVWLDRRPDRWVVRNLVLSCRVLSRGVEQAVLQHVADRARAADASLLEAHFRPTGRNTPAAGLYPSAGFAPTAAADDTHRYLTHPDSLATLAPDWITLDAKEVPHHV
ncbi:MULTISPECIES: HAD-IIIC family phosphatase [unclassified Streptomyces]|uniref:HAD-IIIC family phosphatase n=1 Tax=unclassified Streptomyces TaxID=2593676 RepID=UPI003813C5F5